MPNLEQYIRHPTPWSAAVTYGSCGLGGFLVGGKLGTMLAQGVVTDMIDKYPQEMKDRFLAIERKAKMELLKRELELWEGVGKREDSDSSWDSIRE